ncbi:MAG: hypothetical protein NC312_12590 [Bacteroides fragilis]|nr:hypothetical protein [Bacteroides fragilis]
MKKLVALLAVSALFASMTVSAAGSPSAAVVASTAPAAVAEPAAAEPAAAVTTSAPAFVDEGFTSAVDAQAAEERGMSANEYYNNAITSTPGVPDAVPMGQGGKILINGVPTNLTASLSKVSSTVASNAVAQAAALGGKLLNVVNVNFPGANYSVATVNFYVKGLASGTKVAARQYVNGVWIEVEVVEARADHVVLNLKGNGPIAFVALP